MSAPLLHSVLVWSAAAFDFALAVFHLMFWKLFGWPARLKGSGAVNAAITQTLNIMLTYVFVAYGVGLLWAGTGPLERGTAFVGAGCWIIRMLVQPLLFGRSRRSLAFAALFALGAALHTALGPMGL